MNWLDVVLLLILGSSMFTSFRKGLTREIIGLVTVVLALLLAIWFYGTAGAYLLPYLSSPSAANLAGFVAVFLGVMLAGSVAGFVAGKFLSVTGLSIVDHLLGAAFGALRGLLVAVALIMAIMAFSPGGKPPSPVVHSKIAPYVADAASVCAVIAPHDLKAGFHNTYAHVKQAWESALDEGIRRPGSGKERE